MRAVARAAVAAVARAAVSTAAVGSWALSAEDDDEITPLRGNAGGEGQGARGVVNRTGGGPGFPVNTGAPLRGSSIVPRTPMHAQGTPLLPTGLLPPFGCRTDEASQPLGFERTSTRSVPDASASASPSSRRVAEAVINSMIVEDDEEEAGELVVLSPPAGGSSSAAVGQAGAVERGVAAAGLSPSLPSVDSAGPPVRGGAPVVRGTPGLASARGQLPTSGRNSAPARGGASVRGRSPASGPGSASARGGASARGRSHSSGRARARGRGGAPGHGGASRPVSAFGGLPASAGGGAPGARPPDAGARADDIADDPEREDDGDGAEGSTTRRRYGGASGFQKAYLEEVKQNLLVSPSNPFVVRKLPSRIIHPPDPIGINRPHHPEDFYKPIVYVCAPFDVDASFTPFCPSCTKTEFTFNGWSGYRRVLGVDATHYAITRRYKCLNIKCKRTYLGWDPAIIAAAPAHIRHMFPVVLTHRLAVTEQVIDLMRSLMSAGCPHGILASVMEEHHRRRFERLRLAYLCQARALGQAPASGQLSMVSSTLSPVPPRFSTYDDPNGYGGSRVSRHYLRSVYTQYMASVEGPIKRKNAMVLARFLSGDHFFKILKSICAYGGRWSFEAAYSLLNEYSEVISVVLAQSKGLNEIKAMLSGVAKRMECLGKSLDYVTLFFTDNPVAEKPFLHSLFKGLQLDDSAAPPLDELRFPKNHKVNYITSAEDLNVYMRVLKEELSQAVAAGGPNRVGLDAEWDMPRGRSFGRYAPPSPVQVVQLSTPWRTLVVHIALSGVTHSLKAFLCDPAVLKVGRNVGGDVAKLQALPGVTVKGQVELATMARDMALMRKATCSLRTMCEKLLGFTLDKTEQKGYWGTMLSVPQMTYAAKDAYAACALYDKMLELGSRFIDNSKLVPGLSVLVVDVGDTCRVARCVVDTDQPPNLPAGSPAGKKRVRVRLVQAPLLSAYVIPGVDRQVRRSLGQVWSDYERRGTPPTFLVISRQLRNPSHALEVAPDTAPSGPERFLSAPAAEGVFDAREEVTMSATDLRAFAKAQAGGRLCEEDESDLEQDLEQDEDDADDMADCPVPPDSFEVDEDAARDVEDVDDDELVEEALRLVDPKDWATSGVKVDVMHVMDRILRRMPKGHGLLALFSRRLSQAMMLSNLKDASKAKEVAAKKWPHLSWAEVLFRRTRWLNKRVRRFVPPPEVLVPRLEAVFREFSDVPDATTDEQLFTPAAIKASKAVVRLARTGVISDHPGIPLYTLLDRDRDGLPLWLCSRGTNANEGVHQLLVKLFRTLKGASSELVHYALLEWVHRHNIRAAARNRGEHFPGHYDTWLVDNICKLEVDLYGHPISYPSWRAADDFTLPEFCCGVMQMDQTVLQSLGLPRDLPGDNRRSRALEVIPLISAQKVWLGAAMGSAFPLLPLHTVPEVHLFEAVRRELIKKREAQRVRACAGATNDGDVLPLSGCLPTGDELTVAFNEAVTERWLNCADGGVPPEVYHKSNDHIRAYLERYERNQNMLNTLRMKAPDALRRDIVADKEGYWRFGDTADTMLPVRKRTRRAPPAPSAAPAPGGSSVVVPAAEPAEVEDAPDVASAVPDVAAATDGDVGRRDNSPAAEPSDGLSEDAAGISEGLSTAPAATLSLPAVVPADTAVGAPAAAPPARNRPTASGGVSAAGVVLSALPPAPAVEEGVGLPLAPWTPIAPRSAPVGQTAPGRPPSPSPLPSQLRVADREGDVNVPPSGRGVAAAAAASTPSLAPAGTASAGSRLAHARTNAAAAMPSRSLPGATPYEKVSKRRRPRTCQQPGCGSQKCPGRSRGAFCWLLPENQTSRALSSRALPSLASDAVPSASSRRPDAGGAGSSLAPSSSSTGR